MRRDPFTINPIYQTLKVAMVCDFKQTNTDVHQTGFYTYDLCDSTFLIYSCEQDKQSIYRPVCWDVLCCVPPWAMFRAESPPPPPSQ